MICGSAVVGGETAALVLMGHLRVTRLVSVGVVSTAGGIS
jgi:hypothetical protein